MFGSFSRGRPGSSLFIRRLSLCVRFQVSVGTGLLLRVFPSNFARVSSLLAHDATAVRGRRYLLIVRANASRTLTLPSTLVSRPSYEGLLVLLISNVVERAQVRNYRDVVLHLLCSEVRRRTAHVTLRLEIERLNVTSLSSSVAGLLHYEVFSVLDHREYASIAVIRI